MEIKTVFDYSVSFNPVEFSPETQPITEISHSGPIFPRNNRYNAHQEISSVCLYQIFGPCTELNNLRESLMKDYGIDIQRDPYDMEDLLGMQSRALENFPAAFARAIADSSDYWMHTENDCDILTADSLSFSTYCRPENWVTIQTNPGITSYAVPFLQIIGETENVRHLLRMAMVCMGVEDNEYLDPRCFEKFSRHQMARGENNIYQYLHDDNMFYNSVRRRVWDLFHFDRNGKIRDHNVNNSQHKFHAIHRDQFILDDGSVTEKSTIMPFAMIWNSMKLDYQETEYPIRQEKFLSELLIDQTHAGIFSQQYLDAVDQKIFERITDAVSQIDLYKISEGFDGHTCSVNIPVNLQVEIPIIGGKLDLQYLFSLLAFGSGKIRLSQNGLDVNHIPTRIDFEKSVWMEDGLTIGITPNLG